MVQDFVEPSLIFLGTEHGLYITFDYGDTWHKWDHDYPSVATQDLKIHPRENDLIIGTFGRAAFILDDITPMRKFAHDQKNAFAKKLIALDTPEAYMFEYIQPRGERFPADHKYSGDNRGYGARLGYYLNIEKKEAADKAKKEDKKDEKGNPEEKKKDDKVTVMIKSLNGDTLRTIKHEPDTCINRVYWYFDTKGVQYPSNRERKKDEDEPGGGYWIAPGQYKVVYKFNEFSDSTLFTVHADPRIKWNDNAYKQQRDFIERYQKAVKLADQGMEQLKQSAQWIEQIKSLTSSFDDSTTKSIRTTADSLLKKIDKLKGIYFITDMSPGIKDDSDKMMNLIYTTSSYESNSPIGQNALNSLEHLEKMVNETIAKINDFTEKEYSVWAASLEKIQSKIIPKTTLIKTN